MKLRFLILSLLFALTVHADIEMRQKVEIFGEGDPQVQSLVIKIKDSGLRLDMASLMSVLMTEKSDGFVSLVHEQKTAVKIPKSSIEALARTASEQNPAKELKAEDFKPTGKKETIAGYETEEYEAKKDGVDAKLWLTKDLPWLKELQEQMDNISKMQPEMGNAIVYQQLPGYPLKMDITSDGNRVVSTVESIQETTFPASEFEIPPGYQTMEMPQIPGIPH